MQVLNAWCSQFWSSSILKMPFQGWASTLSGLSSENGTNSASSKLILIIQRVVRWPPLANFGRSTARCCADTDKRGKVNEKCLNFQKSKPLMQHHPAHRRACGLHTVEQGAAKSERSGTRRLVRQGSWNSFNSWALSACVQRVFTLRMRLSASGGRLIDTIDWEWNNKIKAIFRAKILFFLSFQKLKIELNFKSHSWIRSDAEKKKLFERYPFKRVRVSNRYSIG